MTALDAYLNAVNAGMDIVAAVQGLSDRELIARGASDIAARDLAHACGAEVAWVVQLVEIGIVERSPSEPAAGPEQWRFRGVDLRRALETRRLQRDFGVELDAAALILDLQHEVRRLKAALQAGQLGR